MTDGVLTHNEEAEDALRLAISFWVQLQKKMSKESDGEKPETNQGQLGEKLGLAGRDKYGKFMGYRFEGRRDFRSEYETAAPKLYGFLKVLAPLPKYVRTIIGKIYTEEFAKELFAPGKPEASAKHSGNMPIDDPILFDRDSRYPEYDNVRRIDTPGYSSISGLSVLIRPSNERAEDATAGVSISTLNLIPEHIQRGNHPFFKVRQTSARGTWIDIQGLVFAQNDRVVLSGRDGLNRRNFMASLFFNPDQASRYRILDRNNKRNGLSGVVLGLSSSYAHFVSRFVVFSVPGGFVSENDKEGRKTKKRIPQDL